MPGLGLESFVVKLGVLVNLVGDWFIYVMMPLLHWVPLNSKFLHHFFASVLYCVGDGQLTLLVPLTRVGLMSDPLGHVSRFGLPFSGRQSGVSVAIEHGRVARVVASLTSEHVLDLDTGAVALSTVITN